MAKTRKDAGREIGIGLETTLRKRIRKLEAMLGKAQTDAHRAVEAVAAKPILALKDALKKESAERDAAVRALLAYRHMVIAECSDCPFFMPGNPETADVHARNDWCSHRDGDNEVSVLGPPPKTCPLRIRPVSVAVFEREQVVGFLLGNRRP